jgi:hypothetical protein
MPDPTSLVSQLTIEQLTYYIDTLISKVFAMVIILYITIKFVGLFRFGSKK